MIVESVLIAIGYTLMTYKRFPLSTITFVLLTMALPPLVAGSLLLANRRRSA